jgi:acyl carrier protein
MITIEEIRERIQGELRGNHPNGVTIDEKTVIKDLGLSSLQISEIVFGLEEDHEVEFDAALAADAETLGDLLMVANQALSDREASESAPASSTTATVPPASSLERHDGETVSVGSKVGGER